jgi:hypothetical protein
MAHSLSLTQFTSYFELLTGFFILLGIGDKLHAAFNPTTWIQKLIGVDQRMTMNRDIREYINDYEIIQQGYQQEISSINAPTSFYNLGLLLFDVFKKFVNFKRKNLEINLQHKKARLCKKYLLYESKLFGCQNDENNNNEICNFNQEFLYIINPIYLFFGLVSFILLMLIGLIEFYNQDIIYILFLVFSGCVLMFFLIQSILLLIFNFKVWKIKKRAVTIIVLILFLTSLFILFYPTGFQEKYDYIKECYYPICKNLCHKKHTTRGGKTKK